MITALSEVVVVIPIRNEEERLSSCLGAVLDASEWAERPVRIIAVLDSCTDGSADICRQFEVETVRVNAGAVGVARSTGVALALADCSSPETTWLANTDADTQVPATWLRTQIDMAENGADAVLGVIDLDADAQPPLRSAHAVLYARRTGSNGTHAHVHGANLGVRGSAYLACGGFPPWGVHEDRLLVSRLEAIGGFTIVRSDRLRVTTSARIDNRCGAGLGRDLALLASTDWTVRPMPAVRSSS